MNLENEGFHDMHTHRYRYFTVRNHAVREEKYSASIMRTLLVLNSS